MNLFGFNLLANAWLLALIPPLVAFYFLKLKRPRLEIPSLVLWRQVVNDNRVNSPFQRFKRNILLYLQLLLLVLLILAAMHPYWRGNAARANNVPVLIDVSASMAALDKPGGRSRLDEARERVQEMIDGLLTDQKLCLISFDRTARRLTGFTNNKRVLTDALDKLKVTDVASDLEEALRMAQALYLTADFQRVLIYSDGNFPSRADVDLSFQPDLQLLDPPGANAGITTLNAKRGSGGLWDVFVSVEASSDQVMTATVQVIQDGQALEPQVVTVSKKDGERLIYPIATEEATQLEVRLKSEGFDALASDNVAYLDLKAPRKLWVYTPPGMISYRMALGATNDVRVFPQAGQEQTTETEFDLVISNNAKDLGMDAKAYFFTGVMPQDVAEIVTIKDDGTTVVDWQRTAPLLDYVELAELMVLDNPVWAGEKQHEALELLGYEVIADAQGGPLLLRKLEEEKTFYYALFDTDRSTLPYRLGFPIMVSNLVRVAMHRAGLSELSANRTGVLPAMSQLPPDKSLTVKGPDGLARPFTSDQQGRLWGVAAPHVGRYRVSAGSQVKAQFGVSLLDVSETRLTQVKQIEANEHVVAASTQKLKQDHSFWPKLALLALVVLIVEWWFFQRRPGGRKRPA